MKIIQRDLASFHPEKQNSFTHTLVNHPLLQLDEIKKLALRHPTVRYHSSKIPRHQNLQTAPKDCANGLTLEHTLENIESSGSFVFIMEIEKDPLYGVLIKQVLQEIENAVSPHHHDMSHGKGWLFITSPGGTTPYHRDHESNHYFHIKGKKTLWLWDQNDPEVVSQEENEQLHGVHSLSKTLYREDIVSKATKHELSPGQGVFFPYTAPHMVENGDGEFSISLSVTHMTAENFAIKRVHKMNQLMRKMGMNPANYGKSPLKDNLKLKTHWLMRNTIYKSHPSWKGA